MNVATDVTESKQSEEVPKESEAMFRLLFEKSPDAILLLDGDVFIDCNQAAMQMMRCSSKDQLLALHPYDISPERQPDGRLSIKEVHDRIAAAFREGNLRFEWVHRAVDGTDFPVEVLLTAIPLRGKEVLHVTWRDVTERKRTEEALQSAYQTLELRVEERTREIERRRQVAEGLRDILKVLNSNLPLTEILDCIVAQAGRLMGTDAVAIYRLQGRDGPLQVQASSGLPADFVGHVRIPVGEGVVGRAVRERRPVAVPDMTVPFPNVDDMMLGPQQALVMRLLARYRSALAVPLFVEGSVYGGIVLYYPDVQEYSDEEIGLAETFADQTARAIENARLRAQAEQSAVAAERSRLARDLHDAVTQTLFSASLIAEVLPRIWERNPEEGRRRLDELRELTRGALAEMRTLLLELRPSALVDAALNDLLRQLAESITGRARVPVTVEVEGECALPPEVKVALYRIAQEALNNVAKHAGASQATVSLRCAPPLSSPRAGGMKGGEVELRVSDDGRGFDPESGPPESLGMGIMRERAEAIGAALDVDSEVDHGTQVVVVWKGTGEEQL